MSIFNLIQFSNSGETCEKCVHFQNDPALIEETYPGLTSMSSGFAAVRDRDGICNHNQLYLSAHDTCPHFLSREPELNRVG